jgi:FtsH-binding integral membrane protein
MYQPYSSQPQPSWVDGQTVELQLRERAMFRSVYGWMFVGLLLTAATALWVILSPAMQQLVLANRIVPIILFVAEIGLVINLSWRLQRLSPAAAAASFLIFSGLNGLSLSGLAFIYTGASVAQAFTVAAAMFGGMSLYGALTKRDLTSWGSFFMMGLMGILVLGLINMFVRSAALSFAFSVVGIFVFIGLTAYDTQKIKKMAVVTGPLRENLAVMGALALYLDFINLFILLLRLTGNRRS